MEVKCRDNFNAIFGDGLNEHYFTILGLLMVIGVSTLGTFEPSTSCFLEPASCHAFSFQDSCVGPHE